MAKQLKVGVNLISEIKKCLLREARPPSVVNIHLINI